jgi:predicted secreted protein
MSGDLAGRKVIISIGGSVVATARTKTFTVTNSTINVTAGDDDGIQKLLDVPGEKAVSMSVDGMRLKADTTLLDLSLAASTQAEIIMTVDDTYTLTGLFNQDSYGESAPYNEAVTFTSSYSSAGPVVKATLP